MEKYKTSSGRIFSHDDLKALYLKTHPHETEDGFEIALLLAIQEYKSVKVISGDTSK